MKQGGIRGFGPAHSRIAFHSILATDCAIDGYADGTRALVKVDLSRPASKAKRINITLPERVLALRGYVGEPG